MMADGRPLRLAECYGATTLKLMRLVCGFDTQSRRNGNRLTLGAHTEFPMPFVHPSSAISFKVHTSCLSRAIETAWLCMEEMDCVWVPVRKSWRLNERMYGGLTGLSKKLISQLHGEKQFKKWRRGFDERPPPVDAFSPYYPGNDKRYVEMMKDVPISVWQTMIRSLEAGRFLLARKMPRTESLKDCMSRTIPYFKNDIMQNLYSKGSMKNTLVVSSENAIRGLLMELCDITEGDITSVEIPTGLPMLYDRKTRSICLLDDGKGDPLSRYNFGSKPELLFKNRITSNGSGQQQQQQQQMGRRMLAHVEFVDRLIDKGDYCVVLFKQQAIVDVVLYFVFSLICSYPFLP
mmetsp:Transcript_3468/g.5375  ORF Transcript_3468/g.5375 Transcript_3468/m.5375 type:complete len:348 (-) Transcript_3468:54-1097(-)